MEKRLQLQAKLEVILGTDKVYYQPPETVNIIYPAIMFTRDANDVDYANNTKYSNRRRYTVISIDGNPESLTPGKIEALPLCKFVRRYTKNNLYHDVYYLYF